MSCFRGLRVVLVVMGITTEVLFSGEGGLPGAFLEYGPAPRSLGIGKAFVAVADDAQAIYFNPAGLFQLNTHEVLVAHAQLYGARLEHIAYVLPTREFGSFGIGILNFGAEGLDSRTPWNQQYQPAVFSENAYQVAYAYNPSYFLGLGGTLKLITKNLAHFTGVGIGADAGVLIKFQGPFSLGFTVQNLIRPVVTLHNLSDHYPRTYRLGTAVRLIGNRALITAEVIGKILPEYAVEYREVSGESIPVYNPTGKWKLDHSFHGGVEFAIIPDVLIHRAGVDGNEISFGLGLRRIWGRMAVGVDYAFLLHYRSSFRLSPTHKIGINLNFGGFRVWIDAQPKLFTPTPEDKNNLLWMDINLVARRPIKRWQVLIKNAFGEVMRSYSGWGAPPQRLLWDGLDDAGRLVSDGKYYYEIVVLDQRNSSLNFRGFLVTVLTRGPQGKIEIRPGQ